MRVTEISDLKSILELQKEAFKEEAIKHNDMMMPPMIQTLHQIEEEYQHGTVFFKYEKQNCIIGSVRGKLEGNICRIGRLVVKPEYQNQGIGKTLMLELESYFKRENCMFRIFTGEKSEHALGLYLKLGYTIYRYQNVGNYKLIHMEKKNGNE